MRRRFAPLAAAVLLASQFLGLAAISPTPALAHVPDYPIPNGHFFTEANGVNNPETVVGFAISDDGGIPFWSEYQRLGGIRSLGYPASRRFVWNGWVAQVVQRGILVWHPEGNHAELANVMDDLSAAGYDAWLEADKGIPPAPDTSDEQGLSFDQVRAKRLTILDQNDVIKKRFLTERNWADFYGLPVGYGETDQASVLRTQRSVFYLWKQDEPWARKGTVTVADGGDLAKEAALLPDDVLTPEVPTVFHAASPEKPKRIQVPKLKLDAPIAAFNADQTLKDGSLPTPKTAQEVAWYDFTGRAGEANNAVFAGHVDWEGRSAVFARIKELVNGDQIVLVGDKGTKFTYEVLGCDDVECHLPMSSRSDVDEFIGYSAFAHLTMITCEGQWDTIKKDYSHRRIVRARLVSISDSAGAPQPILADPLPYSQWIYTADAAVLPRDAEGNPLR
jgi:sortase (surface protein transpeptidase)